MQNLNGMELVALSIKTDENRASYEFKLYVKKNWDLLAMIVSGYAALFLSLAFNSL